MPAERFDPRAISFTYGDSYPTMRFKDGKEYRGQVYTLPEIVSLVRHLGLPQVWNKDGARGPERYVEVQVWEDEPLLEYLPVANTGRVKRKRPASP